MKPIWKSYEEFLFFSNTDSEKSESIKSFLAPLRTLGDSRVFGEVLIINEELKHRIDGSQDVEDCDAIIEIIDALLSFDKSNGNYIMLTPKGSFRPKMDYKSIFIKFGESDDSYASLDQLDNSIPKTEDNTSGFFYLYSNNKINPSDMLEYLYKKSIENTELRS